jgi:hypothetical protein
MPDAAQWTTVSEDTEEEIKIIFDTIGDEFIGTYLGTRTLTNNDEQYVQFRFRGSDNGETYFTNGSHSLRQGMSTVRPGQLCKITYAKDIDTGQESPMRSFRVEVAKTTRASQQTRRASSNS